MVKTATKKSKPWDPEEYFDIDDFVDHKVQKGQPKILVQWTGYSEPTWETLEHLLGEPARGWVLQYAYDNNLHKRQYWRDLLPPPPED